MLSCLLVVVANSRHHSYLRAFHPLRTRTLFPDAFHEYFSRSSFAFFSGDHAATLLGVVDPKNFRRKRRRR